MSCLLHIRDLDTGLAIILYIRTCILKHASSITNPYPLQFGDLQQYGIEYNSNRLGTRSHQLVHNGIKVIGLYTSLTYSDLYNNLKCFYYFLGSTYFPVIFRAF